jgi:hypothetical protein
LTECHLLTQQQLSNKTDGSSVIKREKGGRERIKRVAKVIKRQKRRRKQAQQDRPKKALTHLQYIFVGEIKLSKVKNEIKNTSPALPQIYVV